VVIGEGQQSAWARKVAPPWISFLGRVSDWELREYYRTAKALIFPGEEDFGLVPVEAQACGCPVVAYGKGGAAETVLDIEKNKQGTGILFSEPTPEGLVSGIRRFEEKRHLFTAQVLRRNALRFSSEKFFEGIKRALEPFLSRCGKTS